MGMLGSVSCARRKEARKSGNRAETKLSWSVFVRMKERSDPFRMNFLASERAKSRAQRSRKLTKVYKAEDAPLRIFFEGKVCLGTLTFARRGAIGINLTCLSLG